MSQPELEQIVHAIAAETNTPEETVARLYADLLHDYRADARILDYVPLLVARRVRETLRQRPASGG